MGGRICGGRAYVQFPTLTFSVCGQEQNPHLAGSPLLLPIKWGIFHVKRPHVQLSNPKMLRENKHDLKEDCLITSFANIKGLYIAS